MREDRTMESWFAKIRNEDEARSNDDHPDYGIFSLLFLRRSPLITENVFPFLQTRRSCPEFQETFLKAFRKELKLEREILCADARNCEAAGGNPRFYSGQIACVDRRLAINSMDAYLNFLSDPSEGNPGIVEILVRQFYHLNGKEDSEQYVEKYYPLYQMGSFLYDQYVKKLSIFRIFDESVASELNTLYQKNGIELDAVDVQFCKYKLLSFNDNFSILNSQESQTLTDARIDKYLWLDVPRELLAAIECAIERRWITDISFGIRCITPFVPAFEALEYGKVFNFQALELPAITKFYDDEQYEDALWIKMEKNPSSMTFEELCADFPVLESNVVTQVVHLEFFLDQGQYFINHLDHEYILYSEEDYNRRRSDASVKGHRKCKTFKIDNARIPFDFSFRDCYFLYLILDAYFKNKRLIREYFDHILHQ